jgi:hypothetical protein
MYCVVLVEETDKVFCCELSNQEAMGYGDPRKKVTCFRDTGDRGEILMQEVPYARMRDIWQEDDLFRLFRAFGQWAWRYGHKPTP